MRNAPRVRIGSATACSWNSGKVPPDSPSQHQHEACLVGVFAGHIVSYERSPPRLLVRQPTNGLNTATDAISGDGDLGVLINLPEVVEFASHHGETARFVLMWSHVGAVRDEKTNGDASAQCYVADAENKSLVSIPFCDLPATTTESSNNSHMDGVVSSSGEDVALFDASRGWLWHWSASKFKLKSQQKETGHWKQHLFESRSLGGDGVFMSSTPVTSCAGGKFMNSSLLGRCFMLVRASWDLGETVFVEKWIFDIEVNWRTIKTSSTKISVEPLKGKASSAKPPNAMQLRMNSKWTRGVLTVDSMLIEFAVDWELLQATNTSAHSCTSLEKTIVDLTWVSEGDILALLVADGQITIASSASSGSFYHHDIEVQSTLSKWLTLSSLMSEVIPSMSRVLWLAEEGKMLVQTGSDGVIFPVEMLRYETQSKPTEEVMAPQQPVQSESRKETPLRMRRRRRTCSNTRVDDELRDHLEQSASPSAVALLEIARIALYESATDFQDVFFTLVSIIYQQLKRVICRFSSKSIHIEEEHIDQKLLEAILSLIMSAESKFIQRVASKILLAPAAFTTRAEKRQHYRREMNALSRIARTLIIRQIGEDQSSSTPSRTAFFHTYLPKISSLLESLLGSVASGDTKSPFELCRSALCSHPEAVLHEVQQALSKKPQTVLTSNSASLSNQQAAIQDSLLLVIASYAMVCSFLRIDSVHLDLYHVLSVAQLRQQTSLKREQLAWFGTNRSHSTHASIPAWNLETALEFARATQTIGTLVEFCTASKSLLAHECLKEICILQAKLFLNSKNILFEKRVEVTRQFESLHLQICESYIGEMVDILREVPLVLQFKHSAKGSEAIHSEAFGLSKDVVTQRFEAFTKRILTKIDDVDGVLPAFRKRVGSDRLWKHSSRETRVRSRCLCLKSQILWHLKQLATCDEQSLVQIFERIFLIDFLSGRCGNTEEAKLIAKFIDKAQDAISCDQWQQKRLSFDNYQQLFNKSRGSQSHFRVDKIVRSLALLVWAIWIRERCAYCLRSIGLLKVHELLHKEEICVGDAERMRLGSLAATCALQLNVLGILVGKPDDIFALQISLLEEAAKLNTEKAVAVICWAFPADKIQARYLKRYKSLRQALRNDSGLSTDAPPIEETEHRCQFIQRHVKRSIRWSITSGSMKPGSTCLESPKKHEVNRSWTAEIDVLVDCCCDLEFQKTTWALIQKNFAGGSRDSHHQHGNLNDPSISRNSNQLKKMLVQSRSSTAEGVISRKEVMLLLQEQKRELEGKVRSWSAASLQVTKTSEVVETTPTHPAQSQNQKTHTILQASTDAKSIRKSFAICGIASEGDVDELKSPNRKRKQSHQTERRESVQNVLKLLSLRKQHGNLSEHRSGSLPNLLRCPEAQRFQPYSQRAATNGSVPAGTENAPSPKRHARENGRHRIASFALSSKDQEQFRLKEPREHLISSECPPRVFPLRYEAGVDSNSCIKLLSRRASSDRTIPLKAKQFSFQQRELSSKHDDRVQAWNGDLKRSTLADEACVNLKTTGAQTDDDARVEIKPAGIEDGKHASDQSIGAANAKSDAAIQGETGEDASVREETHESAIQCTFKGRLRHELDSSVDTRAETEGIFNRFPVFIELDPSKNTSEAPKKFLQVTRFRDHWASQNEESNKEKVVKVTRGIDHLVLVSKNEINQSSSDKHDSLRRGTSKTELLTAHQTRYRSHFLMYESGSKPELSRQGSISNGRSSLIEMKEDMERLKTRLAQLEHCADEIDEDFKESHHKLDRIEKEHDNHDAAAHTHLLDTIDDTLEETSCGDLDPLPATSVLSKKASKDIGAAKKLIETIEQIALDDANEGSE